MRATSDSPEIAVIVAQIRPTPWGWEEGSNPRRAGGASGDPPGSRTGARIYRGDLGTWEIHPPPRQQLAIDGGPGKRRPQARSKRVVLSSERERKKRGQRGIGKRGKSEATRDGFKEGSLS